MIEAVNSVISNAPLIRTSADQVASSRSFAADAAAVESVARMPLAPYISPYISMDTNYDKAVLQLRDSDTGDVVNQFPSEQTLRTRQRVEKQVLDAQLAHSTGGGDHQTPAPVAADSGYKSLSSSVPTGITVVQESTPSAPAQSLGAGVAQAAIAALSLGAAVGQSTSTVSVTA
jgi:hypothetical protein